jgi:hypothetical protein
MLVHTSEATARAPHVDDNRPIGGGCTRRASERERWRGRVSSHLHRSLPPTPHAGDRRACGFRDRRRHPRSLAARSTRFAQSRQGTALRAPRSRRVDSGAKHHARPDRHECMLRRGTFPRRTAQKEESPGSPGTASVADVAFSEYFPNGETQVPASSLETAAAAAQQRWWTQDSSRSPPRATPST